MEFCTAEELAYVVASNRRAQGWWSSDEIRTSPRAEMYVRECPPGSQPDLLVPVQKVVLPSKDGKEKENESAPVTRRKSSTKQAEAVAAAAAAAAAAAEAEPVGMGDALAFFKSKVQKGARRNSSLTQEIADSPIGPASPMAPGARKGRTLRLEVTLPWGVVFPVNVYEATTVHQAIGMCLAQYGESARKPDLGGSADDYTLHVVDDDGSIDTDFPLDRSRPIIKFGDDKFALCRTAAASAASSASSSAASTPSATAPAKQRSLNDMLREKSKGGRVFVKVWVDATQYVTLAGTDEMTLKDLLDLVGKKRKRYLGADQWCFHMTEQDRVSRSLPDKPLDSSKTLKHYDGVVELRLAQREYADRPRTPTRSRPSQGSGAGAPHEAPKATTFMFTEMSAGQYKEYVVIKFNKYGMKQERVLGVDRDKIYNFKGKGDNSIKNTFQSKTKRPSRLIKDVLKIGILEHQPANFRIMYAEEAGVGSNTRVYEYQCQHAKDCAEIVARIKFLMSLHKG